MERTIRGSTISKDAKLIRGIALTDEDDGKHRFPEWLAKLRIDHYVDTTTSRSHGKNNLNFSVKTNFADELAPDGDTSELCRKLGLVTSTRTEDLETEILLAMLLSPIGFEFPSFAELRSSVHIRRNIVQSARLTGLSFATDEAERPEEYWTYDEDRGFIINPGVPLIDALKAATQPGQTGKRYTFSCRRAGEYVVLLSIAMEAADCNPSLFHDLHRQAETRALKGREFEGIFQRHHGSFQNPVPLKYFVPGDRTWFRNPEPISAEITGYEGSWTFYLGDGIFADFWRPNQHYSLLTKCLSIFHWRNSTFLDANGELQIDEKRVEAQVDQALSDPATTAEILKEMLRLQEPLETIGGGCVEAHREYIRQVCPGTADIHLPDLGSVN